MQSFVFFVLEVYPSLCRKLLISILISHKEIQVVNLSVPLKTLRFVMMHRQCCSAKQNGIVFLEESVLHQCTSIKEPSLLNDFARSFTQVAILEVQYQQLPLPCQKFLAGELPPFHRFYPQIL